jgi:hypothetical protein
MEPDLTPAEEPALVSGKPYLFVLLCGISTSILALAGVYWLNKNADDFHIMGWYANYVLPVGAVIVGLVAGSGYGIASWRTGVRISKGLLWAVVLLQTAAYIGAEYVEYRDVASELKQAGLFINQPVMVPTFLEYYDLKARSFAWKPKDGKAAGDPMGAWGYVFVLLGAAGFIGGGLIAPAVLYSLPYCDSCQRYMSSKVLGVIPASVPHRKIAKGDAAAQEAFAREQEEAAVKGDQAVRRIGEAVEAGNVDAVKQELAAAGTVKANNTLPQRVEVSMTWCKFCEGGRIGLTTVTMSGGMPIQNKLGEAPLTPEFVRAMLAE